MMNQPLQVFCCYAREDRTFMQALKKHLRPLQREDLIDIWYDRDISAGTEWAREVIEHLNSAQIILLLVSPAFMDSEYCYSIEMRRAIERHEKGTVCVVPIILRPVIWNHAPFGKLQVLPTNAEPVSSRLWDTRDHAFLDIARGIQTMTRELQTRLQDQISTAQQTQTVSRNPSSHPTTPQSVDSVLAKYFSPLTEHPECAWIMRWDWGEVVHNIELKYESTNEYESAMPESIKQAVDDWCMEKGNETKSNNLRKEPAGLQVRLEKVEWQHATLEEGVATHQSKLFVWLSPTKYLYYLAIHRRLGHLQLRSLREKQFANTFMKLKNGEALDLPANFALHMAVVSQDKYLLLRRRLPFPITELYPSAWEAGIGEFMHGPVYKGSHTEYPGGPSKDQYHHFKNETPDLPLFLKNAVAEELGYREARQRDFRLYGFAIEHETLAPKLLVVYNSDLPIDELLKKAERAADHARELDKVKLTSEAIASICSRYSSWGPTSKLVMLLALKQDLEIQAREGKDTEIEGLKDVLNAFEPDDKLSDTWKLYKQ